MNVGFIEVDSKNVEAKSATSTRTNGAANNNIGRDVAARIFMGLAYDDAASCGLLNSRWKAWFDYFLAHVSTELRHQPNKIDDYGLPKRSVGFLNFTRTQSLSAYDQFKFVKERKEVSQNDNVQHLSMRFEQLIGGSCCNRLQSLEIGINLSNLSNGKRVIELICVNCPKLQSLSLSISSSTNVALSTSLFADINPTTLSTFFRQLTELKLTRGPLGKDDIAVADPVAMFVVHLVDAINNTPDRLLDISFSSLKKLTLELVDLKSRPVWLEQRKFWKACANVEELTWRVLSNTSISSICYQIEFKKVQRLHFSNWLIADKFEFFAWIADKLSLVHLTLENISIENIHYDYRCFPRTEYYNLLLILNFGKQCAIDCTNSHFLEDFILSSPHLVALTFSLRTNFESNLLSNNSEYQWTRALLAKLKPLKDLRHLTIHLTSQDQIPLVHRIIKNHLSPFPPAFELNLLVDKLGSFILKK